MHSFSRVSLLPLAFGMILPLALAAPGNAQEEKWTQYLFGGAGGVDGNSVGFVEWDDGSGNALYGIGGFEVEGTGEVVNLGKWNGHRWVAVPHTLLPSPGGLASVNAGPFFGIWIGSTHDTPLDAPFLAHWNGESLREFTRIDGPNYQVHGAVRFNDGSGDALFIGGEFDEVAGEPMAHFAKWDGEEWSFPPGADVGEIHEMIVFDGAIYAVVNYTAVLRWDGAGPWEPVGLMFDYRVRDLCVGDDGSGPTIFAGGHFEHSGNTPMLHVAKLVAGQWAPMGAGLGDGSPGERVSHLAAIGSKIYASGDFENSGQRQVRKLAMWNGEEWRAPYDEAPTSHGTIYGFDDSNGSVLFASHISIIDGVHCGTIGVWDGDQWRPASKQQSVRIGTWTNAWISDLQVWDGGSGPDLYAAGHFRIAGSQIDVNGLARWDGERWHALGSGIDWPHCRVSQMIPFGSGANGELYFIGMFDEISGVAADNIAKWDGSEFAAVPGADCGERLNQYGAAAVVFDDGTGDALYISVVDDTDPEDLEGYVVRWDGSTWTRIGDFDDAVYAFAIFDDGSGEALYAGGGFTDADGVAANRIARWNGNSWEPVGSGTDAEVLCMTSFDDGTGAILAVGGYFSTAGGVGTYGLAHWDGESWSGWDMAWASYVTTMLSDEDHPDGPRLYIGGDFSRIDGVDSYNIARWDGTAWSSMDGIYPAFSSDVWCMETFEDAGGHALYVGGHFDGAGPFASKSLARNGPPMGNGAVPAELRSVEVLLGEHLRGNKAKLRESDDRYYRTLSTFEGGGGDPNILKLRLIFRTEEASPRRLNVDVESHINDSGASEKVYLLNVNTGNYDLIDARPLGQNESVFKLRNLPADRYVDSSGRIRVLIRHTLTAGLSKNGFKSFVDRVTVDVKE